ncbi:hypothetical protein [Pseudoxanthomonas sp. 10H]|uniref:hypothetical protein n=1 Tax=Pseudoxanthomonas sp. 10H TaxID=3242729 RepID=UPI0035582DF4
MTKTAGVIVLMLLAAAGIGEAAAQVVVMAHPESGSYVVVANQQGARLKARERAQRQHAGGWTELLASTRTGWGRAYCARPKGGPTRYFVVEGKASAKEADDAARAAAIAGTRGLPVASCFPGWENRNAHPLDPG